MAEQTLGDTDSVDRRTAFLKLLYMELECFIKAYREANDF